MDSHRDGLFRPVAVFCYVMMSMTSLRCSNPCRRQFQWLLLDVLKLEAFMKEYIDGDIGTVSLDENVVAQVAGLTALDCFGIVGMGIVSLKDGLVKQLKRDNISKGVSVKFDENGDIVIDFHIVVAYGVSIKAVTDNLMQSVKYKVEDFTSLKVSQINVYVEDVKVLD